VTPKDFTLTASQALSLSATDELVEEGLSRQRSEKISKQLTDLIDGPWTDLLAMIDNPTIDPEIMLLQTAFIAYISAWTNERIPIARFQQAFALDNLSQLDNPRETDHG
jgi:hypothetical protein